MRLISLKAENVRRLEAAELRPSSALVLVGGRNGSGKSSLLDAITLALVGPRALAKGATAADEVREGAKAMTMVAALGDGPDKIDYIVTREIRADGTGSLKIEKPDGSRPGKPQSVLDSLVGRVFLDPEEFLRQAPDEQVETLRRITGLDLGDLDGRRSTLYEERTGANARRKSAEARLAACPATPDGTPADEVDARALVRELSEARASADEQARWGQQRSEMERRVQMFREQLAAAEQALADLRPPVVPQVRPVAELEAAIATADTTNKAVRARKARLEIEAEAGAAAQDSERLTAAIEAIDAEKRARVAAVKMPVEGLAVDGRRVTFAGHPLAQCSQAERLRVSTAIALAVHPALKLALIRNGSLLDDDAMRLVGEMAEAAGGQAFVEVVGEHGGACALVLEEGRAKEQAQKGIPF